MVLSALRSEPMRPHAYQAFPESFRKHLVPSEGAAEDTLRLHDAWVRDLEFRNLMRAVETGDFPAAIIERLNGPASCSFGIPMISCPGFRGATGATVTRWLRCSPPGPLRMQVPALIALPSCRLALARRHPPRLFGGVFCSTALGGDLPAPPWAR